MALDGRGTRVGPGDGGDSPLVGGNPTLVAAQAIIEFSPGAVATWAIETFGSAAQLLLVGGVVAGILSVVTGVGWLLSRLAPDRRRWRAVRIGVVLCVVATTGGGFAVSAGGISTEWLLATILAMVPPVVSGGRPAGGSVHSDGAARSGA